MNERPPTRLRTCWCWYCEHDEQVARTVGPTGDEVLLVALFVDLDVFSGRGAQTVPPDLEWPVLLVVDDIEESLAVGRPSAPVISVRHRVSQILTRRQVAEPELIDLVTRDIDRVSEPTAGWD